MPITDRNLAVGTKLWARYKREVHTAEVVAKADDHSNETIAYKLADGREFKSPSAAGAAIMGPNCTCNGRAFWRSIHRTRRRRTSPRCTQPDPDRGHP
jgi:hypothetical protein